MADKSTETLVLLITKGLRYFIIIGFILVIIGIGLLSVMNTTQPSVEMDFEHSISIDYTNCTNINNLKCIDIPQDPFDPCKCDYPLVLTSPLEGDIFMYYELESFNISEVAKPGFFQSRDDNQLKGNLSEHPSEACEPYAYDNGMPIAPCGAIADAMFDDTIFLLQLKSSGSEYVTLQFSSMISPEDKVGFRNPTAANLTEAFQNFTKPKNWQINVWELDSADENNNGFQNERFIGWMKTEWTKKPLWRVNQTVEAYKNGLPLGNYTLRIEYRYPLSWYNGTRKVMLVKSIVVETAVPSGTFGVGLASLIIGLILLLVAAGVLLAPKVKVMLGKAQAPTEHTAATSSKPRENDLNAESTKPLNV